MTLTDEQKQKVAGWIADGANPAEVQKRLAEEFDIRVTYMEVRFLIDDLKVMPKDPEPPAQEERAPADGAAPAAAEGEAGAESEGATPGTGKVSVKVDEITRPGAMVSGSVVFSDGQKAGWLLDQYGRLGLVPETPGYRPNPADFQDFQTELEKALSRFGM